MRRIAVVTAWDDACCEIGRLTHQNKASYCSKHKYTLRASYSAEQQGQWIKPSVISAALEAHDWVVWMDADLVIMQQSVKLQSFLDAKHDLILSYDCHGLNSGVMFWRNSPWSKRMLEAWNTEGRWYQDATPEQTALAYLLYREPQRKWRCVPQDNFNAYNRGHFIWHFAGQENKVEKISNALRSIKHP